MNGTEPSASKGVVLTVEDVGRWKGELRRNRETIARLTADSDKLEERLKAAAIFLDVDAVPESDGAVAVTPDQPIEDANSVPAPRRKRRKASGEPSWADIIWEAVEPAELGVTYAEMRTFALASALGAKLQESDKGYHNAISRLAKDESIIRDHGRLFTPAAYRRFLKAVEAGEASTTVPQPLAYSPMGEAILRIVKDHPGELNGKGVINELRKDPEHNATLTPHETGAYNIIARLVRRGQIVRRDDGLILPGRNFPREIEGKGHNENGALPNKSESAPEAGGAATPPIETLDL